EVKHQVDVRNRAVDEVGIENGTVRELDAGEPIGEVVEPAGREVVEHPDVVALVAQKIDEMGAHVTRAAGDEDAHQPESTGRGAANPGRKASIDALTTARSARERRGSSM